MSQVRVVDLAKDEQGLTEVLDGIEGPHPEQVLLERANEALSAHKMYVGLKAIGPSETAVTVRDLYIAGAGRRLENLKTTAKAGSASC
jgi:hypothetical protein